MAESEIDNKLKNAGFSKDQINEINEGINSKIDVSIYTNPEFLAIQMKEIRLGLEAGIDVSCYAKLEYDWFQMAEIRLGLLEGVDVSKYIDPEISYDRMRQIREGLLEGIDLSSYVKLDAGILKQLRLSIKDNVNILPFVKNGYDADQLDVIRDSLVKNIDLAPFINRYYRAASIREILTGLEHRVNVNQYASSMYNWQQMREIRLGLEERIDASEYTDWLYDYRQMHEIRLGLLEGLDTKKYSSFTYSAIDMQRIRLKMLADENTPRKVRHVKEEYEDFLISVSQDEMEASILIYDKAPKEKDIREALKQNDIRYGVDEQIIKEIVAGNILNESVEIAVGTKPERGVDGWYEYLFEQNDKGTNKFTSEGNIDFDNIKLFSFVEKGQTIVTYHNADYGKPGSTIRGSTIQGNKGREKPLLVGDGIVLLNDGITYTAEYSGDITVGIGRIDITPTLVVNDIENGQSVSFEGNIWIKGNLYNGSFVKATGNIVVDGLVDNATIEAGKNIILKCGAKGARYISAQGDVVGRYFENSNVYAEGSIKANYSMYNEMYAGVDIIMYGNKSVIVGGITQAQHHIEADNIGNSSGVSTLVKCELKYSTANRLNNANLELKNIITELKSFYSARDELDTKIKQEDKNTLPVYLKIENAIYTKEMEKTELEEEISEIEAKKKKIKKATVTVRNMMFEGCEVIIDGMNYQAREASRITVFRDFSGIKISGGL